MEDTLKSIAPMTDDVALKQWFCREVLPLEPDLMRFIRAHWRVEGEFADIRQDIYERLLVAGAREIPRLTAPYLFTAARNVIINRARRAKVISIELVADLESLDIGSDFLTPFRHAEGRDELRRVQKGLELLPPRCREIIKLRKIEGLSTREVAERLEIGIDAVEQQTSLGMRALADFMLGGHGKVRRRRSPPRVVEQRR